MRRFFRLHDHVTVSSSADVFHLSAAQDCRLVPGPHQPGNNKVGHEIHTKRIRNFALCLQR